MVLAVTNLSGFGGGNNFVAVTNTYTSGTAQTETVPNGASQVVIDLWGPGGGGGGSDDVGSDGGGGGGYCRKTISLVGGGTFTWTVGAIGTGGPRFDPGTAGGQTKVDNGTYGTTVTLRANGGDPGLRNGTSPGAGGTASGGDTNTSGTTGANGGAHSGGDGGAGANGGAGGAGGIDGGANAQPGVAPGGGGGGGKDSNSFAGGDGASGKIIFAWT